MHKYGNIHTHFMRIRNREEQIDTYTKYQKPIVPSKITKVGSKYIPQPQGTTQNAVMSKAD
jgi:hypothetical protein